MVASARTALARLALGKFLPGVRFCGVMKVGGRNEGCDTGGRNGNAARRGNGRAPETNGRDRRQADSLAYYEALLLLWNERVHYRARVQERGDHSIFPGAASLQLGP